MRNDDLLMVAEVTLKHVRGIVEDPPRTYAGRMLTGGSPALFQQDGTDPGDAVQVSNKIGAVTGARVWVLFAPTGSAVVLQTI